MHFFWRANGERCRSDAGERKIRLDGCTLGGAGLSFPNGQTVDRRWPSEILVVGDGTNHLGKAATGSTREQKRRGRSIRATVWASHRASALRGLHARIDPR